MIIFVPVLLAFMLTQVMNALNAKEAAQHVLQPDLHARAVQSILENLETTVCVIFHEYYLRIKGNVSVI